ncbi:B3 DNA binding domain [Forsythia ovata]|uniref:B3 DNA binding domain n=1 Tax=Forsythia ovata TaxID=205694 RepID=A0ABD1SLJ1_9LAMI
MSFNVVVCINLQYVPGTFARTHLSRFVDGVKIHDTAGRVWQVRVDTKQNEIVRLLVGDFTGFASAKNIGSRDTRVFKLINGDALAFKVYKVAVGGRGRTFFFVHW